MAHVSQLPCDGEGICMVCKNRPPDEEKLTCKTCHTPWHGSCLIVRPETLASTVQWECPDCTTPFDAPAPPAGKCELVSAIRAIEADTTLTETQKARKRQELVGGRVESADSKRKGKEKAEHGYEVLDVLGRGVNCSFCMQLPERPVTAPCGHNFCLKCFQKWIGQGKRTCAKCRCIIPSKMANQPRINSVLVAIIRTAKLSKLNESSASDKVEHFVYNQDRPDKAYTTERAKRGGKANASSGKIFVSVPPGHFGPILAENDPERNRGVLVGDLWEDRFECRQWGAHNPHVAGICGQEERGAQSVVLSGGYEDDEDHGEWFLYTGSGGRDLSGNKRTNKEQSFGQRFKKGNLSLRLSCDKGYPVRVIRSHKEKRSAYAPEKGLRYDGIYRIERCWRKVGMQGFKVCRYLFVRCDNAPAPWTSDEHGDKVRALPFISELEGATDISGRLESPSWDYDEEEECWKWKKPPPPKQKEVTKSKHKDGKQENRRTITRKSKNTSLKEKVLKELRCCLCKKVMTLPLTTPCGHNFCKLCLEGVFAGQTFERERTCRDGRTLRSRKNLMKCPSCKNDIAEFLKSPQVNRELMEVIEGLQQKTKKKDIVDGSGAEASDSMEKRSDALSGIEENDVPNPQNEELKKKENDAAGTLTEHEQEDPEEDPERACKRMKIDGGHDGVSKIDNAEIENNKAEEATDNKTASPSSPLNVRSSDDDNQ